MSTLHLHFSALTLANLERLTVLADWLWQDHSKSVQVASQGVFLPSATGTAERAALSAYLELLSPLALAELHAVIRIGRGDFAQGAAVQAAWEYSRDIALDTHSSTALEAEHLLLLMPLGQYVRRGLVRLERGAA